MMVIFFIGIGLCSVASGFANTPVQISIGLAGVGVFAAIYHPVGIAMVVQESKNTGILVAVNGIFGNFGVASAALLTGFLIDASGWRSAFIIAGILSVLVGIAYALSLKADLIQNSSGAQASSKSNAQSTTFALPKVFDERLTGLADSATEIGWYAFFVFSVAAFAQLVVGYLLDNRSLRTVFAVVAILQTVFFCIMINLSGNAALITAVAFMVVVFGQIPINDVLVGRMAKGEWRSRAYAARYIVTFSVMASTIPFIAWVHSRWGFDVLFGILAMAALAIFIAVLTLPRRGEFLLATKR